MNDGNRDRGVVRNDGKATAPGDARAPAAAIHQYLRDLASEGDAAERRKVAARDAAAALVAQLADHLHAEAERVIDTARQEFDQSLAERSAALAQRSTELAAADADRKRTGLALQARTAEYADAMRKLEERTREVATLEERAQGLAHEVATLGHHIESLEQARDQFRNALERYQAAAKEQQGEINRNHALQLQELRKALDQAQGTLKDKAAERAVLDGDRIRLAQQVDDAEKDRRQWDRERQRLLTEARDHQAALRERDRLRDSLNQAARDRERIERELADARTALAKERTSNRSAQVAMARSQARAQTLELVVAELRVALTSRNDPTSAA